MEEISQQFKKRIAKGLGIGCVSKIENSKMKNELKVRKSKLDSKIKNKPTVLFPKIKNPKHQHQIGLRENIQKSKIQHFKNSKAQ